MATYRRISEAATSVLSYEFDYYNQAVAFANDSITLRPSKPYKKGSKWVVSIPSPIKQTAKAVKVEDWKKPFALYCEWRGYEGLEKLDAPVFPWQIKKMLDKAQEAKKRVLEWGRLPKDVYEEASSGFGPLPKEVYKALPMSVHELAQHQNFRESASHI